MKRSILMRLTSLFSGENNTTASGEAEIAAKKAEPIKLDPLPPGDITEHPRWYRSLTSPHNMSNARLAAEYEQMEKAAEAHPTESTLIRKLDLWSVLSQRADLVRRYQRALKGGGPIGKYTKLGYEEVLTRGDISPLEKYL